MCVWGGRRQIGCWVGKREKSEGEKEAVIGEVSVRDFRRGKEERVQDGKIRCLPQYFFSLLLIETELRMEEMLID